jgi:L,D-transpeptidase ErfK/SrfK
MSLSLLLFSILFLSPSSTPTVAAAPSGRIVGDEFTYAMQRGDSLARVGARFGVDPPVLASQNGLSITAVIPAGRVLKIDNRHIVPAIREDGILINVPQRLLFYFEAGSVVAWYPVGLGRADWPTPRGSFFIATKEEQPVWDVPRSIQEEMRREGKRVETRVPPGPRNPLGSYWMGLTASGCGIHGTTAPTSVYRFQTHGCIRLHSDDVADLFSRVSIGTPVELIYRPVLLARLEDGSLWLESHPDVYREVAAPLEFLDPEVATVHRTLAREVIRKSEGIATRISSGEPEGPSRSEKIEGGAVGTPCRRVTIGSKSWPARTGREGAYFRLRSGA